MAAGDHLGTQFTPGKIPAPDQYMPITQLMKAHSGDWAKPMGHVFEGEYADRSNMGGGMPYNWGKLRADIGENGIQKPISLGHEPSPRKQPVVADGHHRAMMAIEQGHLFVPVKHYDTSADYWGGSGAHSWTMDYRH
jgi:hypothetical protein